MKNKKVTIEWQDGVIYGPQHKKEGLTLMETTGGLVKETDEFIIIKNPKTKNIKTGKPHPEKQPNFYFIPKGMVKSIE